MVAAADVVGALLPPPTSTCVETAPPTSTCLGTAPGESTSRAISPSRTSPCGIVPAAGGVVAVADVVGASFPPPTENLVPPRVFPVSISEDDEMSGACAGGSKDPEVARHVVP